ncbi:MAG: kinase [Lachnospiraceae bacterium]|nr:kinase [Lachnospiraceae bacterium]
MRLTEIQEELKRRKIKVDYVEEDGCASIDFIWRGLGYHIWEFLDDDGTRGCETNVFTTGKTVELMDDYADTILAELKRWPMME